MRSFGAERKGALVFGIYWGYLGPIPCCASSSPSSLGGILSQPQIFTCKAARRRLVGSGRGPCRFSEVIPLQATVMNIRSSSAQAGGVFCPNWKAVAQTKGSDTQSPPDFSLNTILLFLTHPILYLQRQSHWRNVPAKQHLVVLRQLLGW